MILYDSKISDSQPIHHIDDAMIYQRIGAVPHSLGDIKMFISIFDKVNIFKSQRLNDLVTADKYRLNLVCRIACAVAYLSNNFIQDSVMIFAKTVEPMIAPGVTNVEIFMDQFQQDMDYFVSSILEDYCPYFAENVIRKKFLDFINLTLEMKFYQGLQKNINNNLHQIFAAHQVEVDKMIHHFIISMKDFCNNIEARIFADLNLVFNRKNSKNHVKKSIARMRKILSTNKIPTVLENEINNYNELVINRPPLFSSRTSEMSIASIATKDIHKKSVPIIYAV